MRACTQVPNGEVLAKTVRVITIYIYKLKLYKHKNIVHIRKINNNLKLENSLKQMNL